MVETLPISFSNLLPMWYGAPASSPSRSFTTIGTPRNGPSGRLPRACVRARSNNGWMTALSSPFSFSMRAIAASTSSSGLASPERTSSAWAVASRVARSVTDEKLPADGGCAPRRPNRGGRRPTRRSRARRVRVRRPGAFARGTRRWGRRARDAPRTRSPTCIRCSGTNVTCSSETNNTCASSIVGSPWSIPSAFNPQSATAQRSLA